MFYEYNDRNPHISQGETMIFGGIYPDGCQCSADFPNPFQDMSIGGFRPYPNPCNINPPAPSWLSEEMLTFRLERAFQNAYESSFATNMNPSYFSFQKTDDPVIMKEKQEDNQMSYVGMMRGEEGIVAFGDSKGTRYNQQMEPEEDKNPRKKVFKCNDFIMVTWGTNEYCNEKSLKVPIETLIDHIFNDILYAENNVYAANHKNAEGKLQDFLTIFWNKLSEQWKKDLHITYHFIFGIRGQEGDFQKYRFLHGSVGYFGCQLEQVENNPLFVAGGCPEMGPSAPIPNPFLSLDEMKTYCRVIVESVIRMGNASGKYNPVGGEVQIETFQ